MTLSDLVQAICKEAQMSLPNTPSKPVKIPSVTSATLPKAPRKPQPIDILPQPFSWVEIPGSIGKTSKGEPYAIAKYPITNAQFAKFIEADGYNQGKWWTEAGWSQRENKRWMHPRYWNDAKWNGAEQPVVGVSWFESVAFCLWLSHTIGEQIMLPTEDQWQLAAQGGVGCTYPWGGRWDRNRCNNSVRGWVGGGRSHRTTWVRQYEGVGDSPFGVVDMAGNVWEWCLTDYDNKKNDVNSDAYLRVLRGGSWGSNNTGNFRADFRYGLNPHDRDNVSGFRVARFS
jgi:formylglycine-generating enzyme required for sulfatase activity